MDEVDERQFFDSDIGHMKSRQDGWE